MLLLFILFAFFAAMREMFITIKIYKNQKNYCVKNNISNAYLPSLWFFIVKRFEDICVSFVFCLVMLPIFYIVLAPIIKLNSKGPVIYKQKRIGLFGKQFTCYKFRSMYLNSNETMEGENDPRVTKVGRIIRKTHIDETPQFFNVLIGDMSLVGPRPYTPFAAFIFQHLKRYPERLLVRPGITGLAQIHSNRTLKSDEVLHFDLTYLENMSFLKDISICLETLKFKDVTY